ncbi:MAG: hypothetical protein PHD72_02440 [Patescibacteria group bacterium]|nr:hypothetical protein [Patescibacteria group bacterium]
MEDILEKMEKEDKKRAIMPFILLVVFISGVMGLKIVADILGAQLAMNGIDVLKEIGVVLCYFAGLGLMFVLIKQFQHRLSNRFCYTAYFIGVVGAFMLVFNQMVISREMTPYRQQFTAAAYSDCRVTGVNGHTLRCGNKVKAALANRDKWLKDHWAIQIGGWKIHAYGVKNDTYEPNLFAIYLVNPLAPLFPAP